PLFSSLFFTAEAAFRTVAAIAAIAARATVAAVATIAAVALLAAHHRRRTLFMVVDADGEEADDVLVDVGLALELGNRRGRGIDVEGDVMGLAVLGDAVSEAAQAPGFGLDHRPAVIGQDLGRVFRG